jgi:hypothetical protein
MICPKCGSKENEHDCKPIPFRGDEDFVKWRDCPCCKGRGWFLIEPFARHKDNHTSCKVCEAVHKYYEKNHRIPDLDKLEAIQCL